MVQWILRQTYLIGLEIFMKYVMLTNGLFAKLDDEVQPYALAISWNYLKTRSGTEYASTHIHGKTLYLHYFVANRTGLLVPEGYQLDHKDRDGLNNQKENLRIATVSQNAMNRKTSSNNTSGKIGVCPLEDGRFLAYIDLKGFGKKRLGYYDTFEEAKAARITAELEYFGKFSPHWMNED
jgi:hypothetical protein